MLDAIDQGNSPTIMGDGSEAFDFVAVEDCARANICAMKSDAVDKNYNVGTGVKTTLKELAEMIVDLTECDQEIKYIERSAATLVRNRIGCPKNAKKDLDYFYTVDLRNGLKKLIEWRKSHIEELEKRRNQLA